MPTSWKLTLFAVVLAVVALACQPRQSPGRLVVYCGRSAELVKPLIDRFRNVQGGEIEVRFGGTAELAALIREEGRATPADVYFGQDAGALGQLAKDGFLRPLPPDLLDRVEARFRSPSGRWVGTSGRARVLLFDSTRLSEEELPDSVLGLTDAAWRNRVGWAARNGSFQSFVTAMRLVEGEAATRAWLEAMIENGVRPYPDNTEIFEATREGEVEIGLVNHYYLYRYLDESNADVAPVRNYSPRGGGPGALVNVAGVGVVSSSENVALAEAFVAFLLSIESQSYFAQETFEYPLVEGVEIHPLIPPLSEIGTPAIDLGELDDLDGTLRLLQDVGAL